MQTFLPYPSFWESAAVLDNRRLNKQIVEAKQILDNLHRRPDDRDKWQNHPALQMWIGYDKALVYYLTACIEEWHKREYTSHKELLEELKPMKVSNPEVPYWLNDPLFHTSHKSNLLFKSDHYIICGWLEINEPYIPYVWPTFYNDWRTKELSIDGVKSLIKGLKRRGLWENANFQWPGFNVDLGISWDSVKPVLHHSIS